MPVLPVIKKGAFIEFMRDGRKLRGEVYKISQNESGRFRYHVFVNEYKGDQWIVEDNQIIGIITEDDYKIGFNPFENFSEYRTKGFSETSLDGSRQQNRNKRKKKSRSPKKLTPYQMFVKQNFSKYGSFAAVAQAWRNESK